MTTLLELIEQAPGSATAIILPDGGVKVTYDVSLCVMPLFHVHGLIASMMSTLSTGGTVVVPPKFNPLGFWRMVRDTNATWYSAVPTMHQLLIARLKTGEQTDIGNLRFIRSCSAALSPETMKTMEDAFRVPVLEGYGMTEASHQMASNPLPPGPRTAGSVGPGTGVDIGIMDDAGTLLKRGEHGEIVIQGPNVITGYENNPDANAAAFSNGWFRTGDRGFLDKEGYLTLVARIKERSRRSWSLTWTSWMPGTRSSSSSARSRMHTSIKCAPSSVLRDWKRCRAAIRT